ncbi:MAG: RNA-binding cell elongation regulator Jag/EloR [Clostridiaceae bacterium]|nr:RNA-binding cell elongation regulator Jag/EloR [Clostridiaceae bacterium]
MVKRVEASGKSTEEAIRAALAELGVRREDVVIEELVKPRSGFFGIGAVDAKVAVTYTAKPAEEAREFLAGLLERMGVTAEIAEVESEDGIALDIRGENMGVVIGRRGDTLDALQYITSIVVNRGQDEHIKLTIDTENYRAKREESLASLANKVAGRVLKYKKSVTLEPMSAYERRVIHSTLQNTRGVTTFSTGSDPNRRVVIALANNSRPPRRTGAPRAGVAETKIEPVTD